MQLQQNAVSGAGGQLALAPLRIWIVGDIKIARPLVHHGAQVHALESVAALYRELAIVPCDIVLIDTALAGAALADTVLHLRRCEDLGVVLLVDPATPQAAVQGLWAGADGCLEHRPEPALLAAKLHSLRRRLPLEPAPQAPAAADVGAGWLLKADNWDLYAPNGHSLALTEAERAFLSLLFAEPGETVGRDRLIAALTEQPWNFDPHRLEVLVHRLRNRVRKATGCALPVRAVRGAGYRISG